MKSGPQPTHFTPSGLGFSDGTEVPADVIVFCTGFVGNMRTNVAKFFGHRVADSVDDFWGLDDEAELKGAFKGTGRECLFFTPPPPPCPPKPLFTQWDLFIRVLYIYLIPIYVVTNMAIPPPKIDPGLWYMGGTIGHARYFSRHVALQIKAELMGMPLPVYEGERRH